MFNRRRTLRTKFFFFLFVISVIWCFVIVDRALRQPFFDIAEARAVQLATEAINKTLQQEISDENINYPDFVHIDRDNEGHVTLVQANTSKVNRVAANVTLAAQKTLEEMKWQSFGIPLGQVLGISILANYGPRVNVVILPVGTVRVSVVDKFEAAGINQTRHSIYLNFDTSVRVVIPTKSGEAMVKTQVPLAESIIVGVVPSTFVSISGGLLDSGAYK